MNCSKILVGSTVMLVTTRKSYLSLADIEVYDNLPVVKAGRVSLNVSTAK